MTDNVNWGSSQVFSSYNITSASSGGNSGFVGSYQAIDWGQYYATYRPSQVQHQWSQEYRMQPIQPISAEDQRIIDGWDPDENKESA